MNSQKKHLTDRVGVYAIIWCCSYVGSLFALQTLDIPSPAGIVLVVVTVLAFALFAYKYFRGIVQMDEVQVKIHMEAIVFSFSLGLLLLMTLGLLELVVGLNEDDWSYRHMLPVWLSFYFMGLFISKRKYQFDDEKHP
ncbi:MAG: hypothetical protein SF053_01890 [Bacteroidia bacterium]|nr:hypothetical protein [Bacteroidia bacterium]